MPRRSRVTLKEKDSLSSKGAQYNSLDKSSKAADAVLKERIDDKDDDKVAATIVKKSGGFKVVSHTGKNLGGGKTKEAAQKRLRQVEYFKHKDKVAAGGPGSGRHKEVLESKGWQIQKESDKSAQWKHWNNPGHRITVFKQAEFGNKPGGWDHYSAFGPHELGKGKDSDSLEKHLENFHENIGKH